MAEKITRDALRQCVQALDGISDDERSALLELINTKKYGLVWENSPEEVEENLRRNLPVLEEVKERHIKGSTPDSPNHIIIEGDNLEALNVLSYTHEGKIDVIYIDPPYNTGKKDDFIYNDDYISADNEFRHSKWLSFMNKRLRLARKLLSEKGVIFLSIDNNEFANLKLLCDEILLEKNFVASFCVIRAEGGGLAKQVIIGHDYCLVYAKNISSFVPLGKSKDIRGKVIEKDGVKYWIQEDWLRKEFGKYGNCHYEELLTYKTAEQKKEIDDGLKSGKYVLIPKSNGMNIIGKLRKIDEDSSKFYSVIKHLNKDGVNELKDLSIQFDYPKPLSLIKELVSGATIFNKKTIILDFFAGSGTTLHAVMQLNKEDGGKRQCILVTNNENNICEEVTYERNKRIINGYTTPKGVQVEGLKDNSLRYYRTRLMPRQQTTKNMRALMAAAADLLCIKEDLYDELPMEGLDIKNRQRHVRLFGNDKHQIMIIYNEEAIGRIVQWLATGNAPAPQYKTKVYTFSYSDYAYDDDFDEVANRVQLCALPSAIYEAYRRVLPKEDRYYDNLPINEEEEEQA